MRVCVRHFRCRSGNRRGDRSIGVDFLSLGKVLSQRHLLCRQGRSLESGLCASRRRGYAFERKGEAKKKLRVTLPTGVRVDRGVRIIIDQSEPIERPYAGCFVNGCIADYDDGMELIDRLKQGRTLVLEAIDKTDSPIRLSVPLADFADAYDGEPQEPKVFEETAKKLQAELHQREVRCETGK
jgi:hypothetical protein